MMTGCVAAVVGVVVTYILEDNYYLLAVSLCFTVGSHFQIEKCAGIPKPTCITLISISHNR